MANFRRPLGLWTTGMALVVGCTHEPCTRNCSTDAGPAAVRDASPQDVTDAPVVDADVVRMPPANVFGAGFTDLTAVIEQERPFTIPPPREGMDANDDVFALFGDVDHRLGDELVLVHWQGGRPFLNPPPAPTAVYRYDRAARQFQRVPSLRMPDMQPLSGIFDLDGDGVTDLLALDRAQAIAWGQGGGAYASPEALDATPEDWERSSSVSSYALDDIDSDGWLDLLVGSECCQLPCRDLHAYFRTGPRTFDERRDLVDIERSGKPYAVFSGNFAPGGEKVIMSIGWSCVDPTEAPVFYHQDGADPSGMPRFRPFDPTPPRAFFRGQMVGVPTMAFNSPMAASADDLNNDGLLDIAFSLNPYHQLFMGSARWPFEDYTVVTGIPVTLADSGRDMIPWGTVFVDLDRDTRLDWIVAHGNDGGAWFTTPDRLIGPQFVGAYWNAGDMRFVPVTDTLHLQRRGQFRTVQLRDFDGDADPDLAVGGQLELARLYRNDITNDNRAMVLKLHGTTSNHLGVGAWISVWIHEGDAPLRRYVGGVSNPYIVYEPEVFLGLGEEDRVARLQVTWPSGTVQELRDLGAGRTYDVVEPAALTVEPAARHAPADGRSAVTVRVTPRQLDGSLQADAVVELSIAGPGTLTPPTRGADGWTARVIAPATRGSAVITARVGGRPLGVRPRVWWD